MTCSRNRSRLNRWMFRILPGTALLTALLIALFLISGVQQQSSDGLLDDSYLWVLIVTILALAILVWAIFDRLVSLVRNIRDGVPGALLSARWVRNFLLLSLPPALIVFFFSAYFLTSTIDSWFDVQVEAALEDSLSLGQEFASLNYFESRLRVGAAHERAGVSLSLYQSFYCQLQNMLLALVPDDLVSDAQAALRDIQKAADAVTSLARMLERNPSALIRGR